MKKTSQKKYILLVSCIILFTGLLWGIARTLSPQKLIIMMESYSPDMKYKAISVCDNADYPSDEKGGGANFGLFIIGEGEAINHKIVGNVYREWSNGEGIGFEWLDNQTLKVHNGGIGGKSVIIMQKTRYETVNIQYTVLKK